MMPYPRLSTTASLASKLITSSSRVFVKSEFRFVAAYPFFLGDEGPAPGDEKPAEDGRESWPFVYSAADGGGLRSLRIKSPGVVPALDSSLVGLGEREEDDPKLRGGRLLKPLDGGDVVGVDEVDPASRRRTPFMAVHDVGRVLGLGGDEMAVVSKQRRK
jgi:hypothetical protein